MNFQNVHDGSGNLTQNGNGSYVYDVRNQMISAVERTGTGADGTAGSVRTAPSYEYDAKGR